MVTATEDRLSEFGRRLAEGDMGSLREYLAAEYHTHVPGPDEPPAWERIADLADDLKVALPDLSARLDDVESDGDGFKATMTISGTHQNDLWGAPGSGDRIEWVAPVSGRVVGDRFAIQFEDTSFPLRAGLLRQLRLVNPADEMDQPSRYPVAMPDLVLKLTFTGMAGDKPCSHLDAIAITQPGADICVQCVDSGDIWPALRMCLICGFVGCCDTSKNRHMAAHAEETGHALMRSIHGDEGWIWCYEDDAFYEKTELDRHG